VADCIEYVKEFQAGVFSEAGSKFFDSKSGKFDIGVLEYCIVFKNHKVSSMFCGHGENFAVCFLVFSISSFATVEMVLLADL